MFEGMRKLTKVRANRRVEERSWMGWKKRGRDELIGE